MTSRTVTTQSELDQALADKVDTVIIDSPRGVWLQLRASGSASVVASGSASVVASGSASVVASGSASVVAYDSASVEAYGSASVEAGKYVSVHLRSARAKVQGGVLIDLTSVDLTDKQTWLDYHGVRVVDGDAILIKAVDHELVAGHRWNPTTYTIGQTVTCPDWRATAECGHGLHFSYSRDRASSYISSHLPLRFLEVAVPVDELIVVGDDKVKAPRGRVLHEVDRHGRQITAAATA